MAGRGMAWLVQPNRPVVQCAEQQIQWALRGNRPLISFVSCALVVEDRLPAM